MAFGVMAALSQRRRAELLDESPEEQVESADLDSMVEMLTAYYDKHCPAKSGRVLQILANFRGREAHMCKLLARKYGHGIEPVYCLKDAVDAVRKAAPSEPATPVRVRRAGKPRAEDSPGGGLPKADGPRRERSDSFSTGTRISSKDGNAHAARNAWGHVAETHANHAAAASALDGRARRDSFSHPGPADPRHRPLHQSPGRRHPGQVPLHVPVSPGAVQPPPRRLPCAVHHDAVLYVGGRDDPQMAPPRSSAWDAPLPSPRQRCGDDLAPLAQLHREAPRRPAAYTVSKGVNSYMHESAAASPYAQWPRSGRHSGTFTVSGHASFPPRSLQDGARRHSMSPQACVYHPPADSPWTPPAQDPAPIGEEHSFEWERSLRRVKSESNGLVAPMRRVHLPLDVVRGQPWQQHKYPHQPPYRPAPQARGYAPQHQHAPHPHNVLAEVNAYHAPQAAHDYGRFQRPRAPSDPTGLHLRGGDALQDPECGYEIALPPPLVSEYGLPAYPPPQDAFGPAADYEYAPANVYPPHGEDHDRRRLSGVSTIGSMDSLAMPVVGEEDAAFDATVVAPSGQRFAFVGDVRNQRRGASHRGSGASGVKGPVDSPATRYNVLPN